MSRRETTAASIAAVRRGDALDVAGLPSYGFSHRSLMWWGNAGMMAIEGIAFGFMIVIYFYLRSLARTWPDGGATPDLGWGTLNLVIILASALPNWYTARAALDRDLQRAQREGCYLKTTLFRWCSASTTVQWPCATNCWIRVMRS